MGSGPKCGGLGMEDWETMLSGNPPAPAPFAGQDGSFPTLFTGNVDDSSSGGVGLLYPSFVFQPINEVNAPPSAASDSLPPGGRFPLTGSSNPNSNGDSRILPVSTSSLPNGKSPPFPANSNEIIPSPMISTVNSFPLPPAVEKPPCFNPNHMSYYQITQDFQNPSFFSPLNLSVQQEHHKQHHVSNSSCQISPKFPIFVPSQDLLLRQPQPQQEGFELYHQVQQSPMILKLAGDESSDQYRQHVLVAQLYKTAELVEAGNSLDARMILARLNHQLFPHEEPLIRSAFYFKEILDTILSDNPRTGLQQAPLLKVLSTPLDVVFKLNAYKYFSEISPIVQFINSTCIQALLEELTGCDHIHIVDLDIGVGGQWSSFIQELSNRRSSAFAPSLKITAIVAPSSDNNLELLLTKDNLSQFASDLGIPFKFNISTLDSLAFITMSSSCSEAIAVNIPIDLPFTSAPTILHLVKKLSPKIVLSIDHNCDRSDLSFSENFLSALCSYTMLLKSIDATGYNLEMSNNIEKYLLQPRIENIMLSRCHTSAKMVPWRTLFTLAGYLPINFSSFTEAQAECLLKRIQARGFHLESRRQGSLSLFWQSGELVSVSAWKC